MPRRLKVQRYFGGSVAQLIFLGEYMFRLSGSSHAPRSIPAGKCIESKYAESPWHLERAPPARVVPVATGSGIICSMARVKHMRPNNALERTVRHRGPRLSTAQWLWPAAQLGR
jgi:hypothetical protein